MQTTNFWHLNIEIPQWSRIKCHSSGSSHEHSRVRKKEEEEEIDVFQFSKWNEEKKPNREDGNVGKMEPKNRTKPSNLLFVGIYFLR